LSPGVRCSLGLTYAPLMSLPRLFRTCESTIPTAEAPYLAPVPGYAVPERMREEGVLRVGLVWAGNPDHSNDRNRSIACELFRDLIRMKDVRFVSLQVESSYPKLPEFEKLVTDLAPSLIDYAATAICLERPLVDHSGNVSSASGGCARKANLVVVADMQRLAWLQNRRDTPWYGIQPCASSANQSSAIGSRRSGRTR
jgi:hypothetical protein